VSYRTGKATIEKVSALASKSLRTPVGTYFDQATINVSDCYLAVARESQHELHRMLAETIFKAQVGT
jgi:hypothetical protein